MRYFLLTYDRRRAKIVGHLEYPLEARDEALAKRAALVREHREDPDLEIVLLGANTFDDLKKTHSRYFKTLDQLAKKTRRGEPVVTG